MRADEMQSGYGELKRRLAEAGLEVLEQQRPWPNRMCTYFEIGKPDKSTDIAVPDEFVRDLPQTKEHQAAVDTYATAVGGRLRCGPPNQLYCACHKAVNFTIRWPIESAAVSGKFSSWLLVHVTNQENGKLARCCVDISRPFMNIGRTIFDDVRCSANSIRRAIDSESLIFYDPEHHPDPYQPVAQGFGQENIEKKSTELEMFLLGKIYLLGFKLPEAPTEVWISDPWDAEYLRTSKKELSQAAYILRARKLIDLDSTLNFARPSEKLLTTGWPAVTDPPAPMSTPKVLPLTSLPKKEDLMTALRRDLANGCSASVIVIDLDGFKQVNDILGHPAGDSCLEVVVKTIGGVLGRKGTLYRWGGDEFIVMLPDFSTDEASATAEKIRGSIELANAGGKLPVTASIGICGTDRVEHASSEVLLEMADKAMYVSKKNGKNRATAWPTTGSSS